ncbi:MAG TPA: hypothetical protein VFD85_00855 [Gemmatimonadales bacterium]|nr:hypothetical protein [Gemmatimonadales bacterium]
MSFVTPIEPNTASGAAKGLVDGLKQRVGRVPNMIGIMAHSPAVLKGYLEFTYAIQEISLPPLLRAQLGVAVAALTGSDYFISLAESFGRRDGLDAEQTAAARRGESSDPRYAAALRFAATMVREQGRVPATEVEALRNAGFGDDQIVEIVTLVALSVFRGTFNLALGTDLDAPASSLRPAPAAV